MTSSDLVLAMLRDMDAGDLDALAAAFRPDASWASPVITASGPEEIVAAIAGYRSQFPDFRHEVGLVFDDGDTVAVEGHWLGTHADSGRSVRLPFAALAQVRDGRVASLRLYVDTASF